MQMKWGSRGCTYKPRKAQDGQQPPEATGDPALGLPPSLMNCAAFLPSSLWTGDHVSLLTGKKRPEGDRRKHPARIPPACSPLPAHRSELSTQPPLLLYRIPTPSPQPSDPALETLYRLPPRHHSPQQTTCLTALCLGSRLNLPPTPRSLGCRPHPRHLPMGPYLEAGSLQV